MANNQSMTSTTPWLKLKTDRFAAMKCLTQMIGSKGREMLPRLNNAPSPARRCFPSSSAAGSLAPLDLRPLATASLHDLT